MRPLSGLLVLDLSQFLAGPSASLRMADLGARVIKIERPVAGDLCRQLYISNLALDGDSTLFHSINRNKQSYAADLKNLADLACVRQLIARADVIIQNFRPGVMEKIGLGYDAVRELNPRIVYGEVTGYGSTGPWRNKPGQDLLVQSLSGLPYLNGDSSQPPVPFGLAVADMMAGAHLVQGILAALVHRSATGAGARVEVSLLESVLDLQFEVLSTYLNDGGKPPIRSSVNNAHAYLGAPYGIYATADGYLALAMGSILRLGELLGCSALATFTDPASLFNQRDEIKSILVQHLRRNTTQHWLSILEPADIWCSDVLTWERLFAHEAFQSLAMVQQIEARSGAPESAMRTTRCPIRIDGELLTSSVPAPRVGEHNQAISTEFSFNFRTGQAAPMNRNQICRIAVRKYPPFEHAIRAQWEDFESTAHSGLELDLVALDLHPLEDALFTSEGMKNGDWDVAFVATDWIAAAHRQRCAVDLAPFLRDDPPADFPGGWTDSLLRLQRIGDAVLGVPYHDGPECLMYRSDLFMDPELRTLHQQQFGQPLAPPATWEDFHRLARFLQRPERDLYGTVVAAFPDGHNTVYDFLLQLWTRGGDLFDSVGGVHFSTPQAVEALAFYRKLLTDQEAVHPGCEKLDSVGAGLAFASGRVAMSINWFGFATMAQTSPDSMVRGMVEVAAIPHQPPGMTASLNVYWILSIAAGSPHRDLAWQFLRHVLTPAMDRLTTTSGAIGCRRSTWADPEVNAAIPFYHRIESLHAAAREIPQRPDWPRIASIIDGLLTRAIGSDTPVETLLRQADAAFATTPR